MTSSTPRAGSLDHSTQIIEALAPLLAHQRQRWALRCHAHGISIFGFHLLALLEEHGEMPMSHLADQLDVALPNATGIVNRMAERALVQRRHDDADRRVVLVGLSDDGRRLIAEMEIGRRDRMQRLFAMLDDRQQRRLLQSVNDLHAAARRLDGPEETTA